jgi:hypothetical protein
MARTLALSGAILTALAAISSIVALLYSAGVLHSASPSTPGPQDYAYTWEGYESPDSHHLIPTQVRLVISRPVTSDIRDTRITVNVFSEAENSPQTGLPTKATEIATGTVVEGHVKLFASQEVNGTVITNDEWVLTLPNPNTLHFTHHTQFVSGGADSDTEGDLHIPCCPPR